MKRLLVLLLAVTMCFSLCACFGNEESKVAKLLTEGTWQNSSYLDIVDAYVAEIYEFQSDGTYTLENKVSGVGYGVDSTETGTYTIEDGKIILTPDESNDHNSIYNTFLYTYEDGELELALEKTGTALKHFGY